MIPLSELRPTQHNFPKFIKISGVDDEGGLVNDDEMPLNITNPFDNHIQDSNKKIKDIKEHDAIDYVASVYKDLMFVLTQSVLPEEFEEVTTFNLDDLKKNIDTDKFVNLIFGRLLELEEDPYDQQLNLVLDEMKKASQQFNIFQWKTNYERLLIIVMTGIIEFEISMMENIREDRS
jgi:hypothetical protein